MNKDVSEQTLSDVCNLPRSLRALGNINYRGARRTRTERVFLDKHGDYVLDHSVRIRKSISEGEPTWLRIPLFWTSASLCPIAQREDWGSTANQLCGPNSPDLLLSRHENKLNVVTHDEANLFDRIEAHIMRKELNTARQLITQNWDTLERHPRALFALGSIEFTEQDYRAAKRLFDLSAKYGHPDGSEASEYSFAAASLPYWQRYKETKLQLEAGEHLRTLTILRASLNDNICTAGVALSEALLYANEAQEGYETAMRVLSEDPYLPSVWQHLVTFSEGLNNASEVKSLMEHYLNYFPVSPNPYQLLARKAWENGDFDTLRWTTYAQLLFAQDVESVLPELFIYHDAVDTLAELADLVSDFVDISIIEQASTLAMWADTQIEANDFHSAATTLERARNLEPRNVDAVLSHSRLLAKCRRVDEALGILADFVCEDPNGLKKEEQLLVIALSSEMLRNSGQVDNAIQLWQDLLPLDFSLVELVGARPYLEFCYCLAEIGEQDAAREIVSLLPTSPNTLLWLDKFGADLAALH